MKIINELIIVCLLAVFCLIGFTNMPVSAEDVLIEPTNNLELVEIDSEITPMASSRKNFSDSGTMTYYFLGLGIVNTDYTLQFEIDSNYTNRTYIDYSGYFLNWYSARSLLTEMRSQTSLSFLNRTGGTTYKSITTWPERSKYDHIGRGVAWSYSDGGNYSYFYSAVGSRTNIESIAGVTCNYEGAIVPCGIAKKTHTLD